MIFNAHEKVSCFGGLKCGGIDKDEAIVLVDHFYHSDEARDLGLRWLGLAAERGDRSEPGKCAYKERPFGFGLGRLGPCGSGLSGLRGLRRFRDATGDEEGAENRAGWTPKGLREPLARGGRDAMRQFPGSHLSIGRPRLGIRRRRIRTKACDCGTDRRTARLARRFRRR